MKILVLGMLAAIAAQAIEYTIVSDATGTANVVTIQQPTNVTPRTVSGAEVSVSADGACTITIERDGTAATATAGTLNPVVGTSSAAKVNVFTASDVGSGTVLAKEKIRAANGFMRFNLSSIVLPPIKSSAYNFTVRVACGSSQNSIINLKINEQ